MSCVLFPYSGEDEFPVYCTYAVVGVTSLCTIYLYSAGDVSFVLLYLYDVGDGCPVHCFYTMVRVKFLCTV